MKHGCNVLDHVDIDYYSQNREAFYCKSTFLAFIESFINSINWPLILFHFNLNSKLKSNVNEHQFHVSSGTSHLHIAPSRLVANLVKSFTLYPPPPPLSKTLAISLSFSSHLLNISPTANFLASLSIVIFS